MKKALRVEQERTDTSAPHFTSTAAFVFRCVTLAPSGGGQARSNPSNTIGEKS